MSISKFITKGKSLISFSFLLIASMIIFSGCGGGNVSEDEAYKLIPIRLKQNGKISLMDRDGNIIIEDEFSAESEIFYSEGVIMERTRDRFVRYYLLDGKKTKSIGEDKYSDGTPMVNGYALVKKEDGILTLIDKNGKEKLVLTKIDQFNVIRAGIVSDDLIRFKTDDGLWGYCDVDGKLKVKPMYTSCDNFYNGKARVIDEDGIFHVIDKSGNSVYKGKEDYYYGPISEDLIGFKENAGSEQYFGVMDLKGEKIIKDNKFKQIGGTSGFKNGLLVVRTEESDSWGVIGKDGEIVGDLKNKFESEPIISSGGQVFINFEKDRKCKIYSSSGELTKEIEDYKYIIPLNAERYFGITKSDKLTIIDQEGKEISKDMFYLATRDYYNAISNTRNFQNELSLESSYFDLDAIYKTVYSNITTTGMCGVSANNNLGKIIALHPYESASVSKAEPKKYVSRSDDYSLIMYSRGKKQTEETEVAEATEPVEEYPDVVEAPVVADTTSATAIEYDAPTSTDYSDPYSYLSAYSSAYQPQTRNVSGGTYRLTFNFNDNLKLIDYADYYPVYTMNNLAMLRSVTCDLSIDYMDTQVFNKKITDKLIAAGWKKSSEYVFTNTANANIIRLMGTSLTMEFN